MAEILRYCEILDKLKMFNTVNCSKEEYETYMDMKVEDLPDDVCVVREYGLHNYYRIDTAVTTEDKVQTMIIAKSAMYLKTIKNCVIYFTVISAIGLFVGLIAAII